MDNISAERIGRLRQALREWGKAHIHCYPWRYESDPYRVLISEFMLHRTQARQVIPVYLQFIQAYPDLQSFVHGNEDEITALLLPLGLNWRIRGMISAAKILFARYGVVPNNEDALLSIPTVGPYIAAATVCFSGNAPAVLVDANTVRVAGRVFGLNLKGEARRRKEVIETITAFSDSVNAREFYYALIDLGHDLCLPLHAKHSICPLLADCDFGANAFEESKH